MDTMLLDSQTNSQILEQYGLNWEVEKKPLFFKNSDSNPVYTKEYGLIRTDKDICLGVCKEGYHPFQNKVILETMKEFADRYNFKVSNGGEFSEGKRIYLQIKIDDKLRIGRDTVEEYLFAANSFDKTTQLSFGYTNIVVSCQNTFNRMMKQDVAYKFRHTSNGAVRVLEIPNLFENHFKFREYTNNQFREWADKKVHQDMIDDLLKHLLETDKIDSPELLTTRKVNILTQLRADIKSELDAKGDTLWGLFNGVTYNANHSRVVKASKTNARMESILIGEGNRIMTKAFTKIAEYAI